MRDPLANPEPLIRRVYAYVAYRIGHGPEAEDLTADTFERALRYRDRYDRSKGEPIAWLLGIARRSVDGALSARRLESELPPDLGETGGDLAADMALRLDLAAAVRMLAARERELIALRYGADLTARQIAALLGERTNTVEVALHRALSRLRLALDAGPAPQTRLEADDAPVRV